MQPIPYQGRPYKLFQGGALDQKVTYFVKVTFTPKAKWGLGSSAHMYGRPCTILHTIITQLLHDIHVHAEYKNLRPANIPGASLCLSHPGHAIERKI